MIIQRQNCATLKQLAADFADYTGSIIDKALSQNQKVSLVVPGGNTPRHYLPSLGRQSLQWRNVMVTLSDERWVDTNTEASNEHLVTEHFLTHMPEAASFVGLKTHHNSPSQAIDAVHKRLAILPLPFCLTVLGLGEDGHIASLFPGMNPDMKDNRLCCAVEPPIVSTPRISLTLKALSNSHNIVIVVTGTAKRRLIDKLTSATPDQKIPFVWLMQHTNSSIIIFETDSP
jgi:6-phosphogluconolactonase